MDDTAIRTTCPRDCYDACGVLVKIATDGTLNVVGDPEHRVSRGALCGKCSIGYNGIWRDPSARLMRPLKRVGPKGTGRFEPTSWDRPSAISQSVSTPSAAAMGRGPFYRPTTREHAR